MAVIDFELSIEREDMLRELAELEMAVARKLLYVMEQVGVETIAFLRSESGQTRPPARPGAPSRRAHPGGWADVSGNLALAYRFELYSGGQMVRWSTESDPPSLGGNIPAAGQFPLELRFANDMEYAVYLEARDGYWVLREVTEDGGPVQRAMRAVIERIDPGARIEVI